MLPLGCQCTKSVPLPNRNELISNVDALDDDGYLRLSVNCVEDKIHVKSSQGVKLLWEIDDLSQ